MQIEAVIGTSNLSCTIMRKYGEKVKETNRKYDTEEGMK